MNVYRLLLIGSLAVILAACSSQTQQSDASGVFEAREVIVSSEAAGKILELAIEEGAPVTANGQSGSIDTMQLYLRKLQILATMKTLETKRPDIRVQIAAIEQQLATAQREKERVEKLLGANAANQKQLDDITAQIALLGKQLSAQKNTLSSANEGITGESSALEIQVAQLDDQLAKCRVVNPISGVVLAKYAEAGEVTAPGKALYKIGDLNNMILRAYIIASQLTEVKLGQKVTITTDFGADSSRSYSGTIAWISDKSEFTPKTIQTRDERANLVYAVKVAVKNDGFLKIGMYGSVILVREHNN